MVKIRHTDKCIGLRAGDTIFLHKNLEAYPLLHKYVLNHEMQHSPQAGMSWREWKMEMTAINRYIRKDFLRFILENPKCLRQILPVQKFGNYLLVDVESCLIIGLLGFVVYIFRGGLP